jgi:FkbM family methyltransferase
MTTHADETRAAAARIEHPWDARALEWPLTKKSVVVEVGGYKGRWALQIAERYGPRLYVFEPQPWGYEVCREVLGDRAEVYGVALGVADGYSSMERRETDGCSLVGPDGAPMPLSVRPGDGRVLVSEIAWVLRNELGLTHIDLMLMNIEGYEYTLLPHMLDQGVLPDRLMVQFHTFADPDGMKTAQIYGRLEELGYRIAWTYGVVLTAWERI